MIETYAYGLKNSKSCLGRSHYTKISNICKDITNCDQTHSRNYNNGKIFPWIFQFFGGEVKLIPAIVTPHPIINRDRLNIKILFDAEKFDIKSYPGTTWRISPGEWIFKIRGFSFTNHDKTTNYNSSLIKSW